MNTLANAGQLPRPPSREPSPLNTISDPFRVSDGARTRDRLDHNQELYQLSYAHHAICL